MKIYLSKPAVLSGGGKNIEELFASCVSGNQSGIKKVRALNGKEFFAGKIDDSLLEKSSGRFDMRIIRIEEKCLLQIEDLILSAKEKFSLERIGVCVGSCDNGTEFSLLGHRKYFENGAFDKNYSLEEQSGDYVATFISEKYGIKGPSLAFETACSSSAGAIIKAAELVRSGLCDAVVAGGVDIASDTVLMGFDSLEAVSSEITNPFSKNRHGITLGEGAAFFLVSKDDFSGEQIELLGYGESADAYHMTSPDPSGDGAVRAIKNALKNAKLDPRDIDYVNLHGTGTRFNDSMEAKAIKEVFADYKVPVSTTKPITGHTLGAAGAIEAAICWQTIKNSKKAKSNSDVKLPLQVWDEESDDDTKDLNFVSVNNSNGGFVSPEKVRICMSNSFAFGGANACLILGKPDAFEKN